MEKDADVVVEGKREGNIVNYCCVREMGRNKLMWPDFRRKWEGNMYVFPFPLERGGKFGIFSLPLLGKGIPPHLCSALLESAVQCKQS